MARAGADWQGDRSARRIGSWPPATSRRAGGAPGARARRYLRSLAAGTQHMRCPVSVGIRTRGREWHGWRGHYAHVVSLEMVSARPHILIVGGGVAALECLLALK